MEKPRIFLGSSGAQAELVGHLTRGLSDVAHVEPWTTVFSPGSTTIGRLLELTREVDFAAFVFASDDWTTSSAVASAEAGQAAPRDNVVFEAGLFGGVLGMPRTFILHDRSAKLPTDLLGLTAIRYGDAQAEVDALVDKLRAAIAAEGRISTIEGAWWQYSITARTDDEASAVSLLRIARDRTGGLEMTGRAWREDGTLSSRYWTEATTERTSPQGIFYYFRGERPRDPNAPPIDGTGEILIESPDRAAGYYTTRSDANPNLRARTSGVYVRADAQDVAILDGADAAARAVLIAKRVEDWKSIVNS